MEHGNHPRLELICWQDFFSPLRGNVAGTSILNGMRMWHTVWQSRWELLRFLSKCIQKGSFHTPCYTVMFSFCNVSTKLPKGFSKKEQTPPPKKKINECPLKRDHLKKKCHLPTINFRGAGICYFSGGVILRIEFTGR